MKRRIQAVTGLATLLVLVIGCSRERPEIQRIDDRVYSWVELAHANDDVDAALVQGLEALRIARAGGSLQAQLKALTCVGLQEVRGARYYVALRTFEEALSLAESAGDAHYEAVALANESVVLIRLGLYDWADERLLRGLNRLGSGGSAGLRATCG